jgi:hypothetical protein
LSCENNNALTPLHLVLLQPRRIYLVLKAESGEQKRKYFQACWMELANTL